MFDGMIELRWAKREREMDAFVMEGSVSRFYTVLQYRRFLPDGSGNRGVSGYTPWQDVPVVEEKKG